MNVFMAWLSYLSTGWEISTPHTILLKPHSGVFVWICSHGGCICSFPKQILEMLDKHPPAECWEMGTLRLLPWQVSNWKRWGIWRKGKGRKRDAALLFPAIPLCIYLPFPPPPPPPPLFCPCHAGWILCCGCDSDLISVQVIDLRIFCRTSKDQAGAKISNNKLFL